MSERIKVYIRPRFEGPDKGEGGIRRWTDAQARYLPEHNVIVVDSEGEAELVAIHAGDLVKTDKPLVAHCHGLYNTAAQEWNRSAWQLNRNVIEVLRRADVVTAPSTWVAHQLARGMSVKAHVLYGGIERSHWAEPGECRGFVLWNKTRVDPVCSVEPLLKLAERRPGQQFVSTFGLERPNLKLTGKLPFADARELVKHASVYLSTSRETFGIGTLEAMAAGVPVLGYAWGGNLDIVEHLKTGYLAPIGNLDELERGLDWCLEHREEAGAAARAKVLECFTWERAMADCAEMYREALGARRTEVKVSVIVTCYRLEEYLGDCLASLQAQTMRDGWECIVVDDCSPVDDTRNCRELVGEYMAGDRRIRYTRTPRNLYLAGARNWGIAQARGQYILCLDADDMLPPRSLEVLAGQLDREPGWDIVYGRVEFLQPDGSIKKSGWPVPFNWEYQANGRNCLPYSAMYRRKVWQRIGGYREWCRTAEDADFWLRATSYGARAEKVTEYPCLLYRDREGSMSRVEGQVNWGEWCPWTRDRGVVPFGCVGKPANNRDSWPVLTYDPPLVSVVIPVGPGHERIVADALDTVAAQTIPRWEVIVVNDSGQEVNVAGHPWARVLETPQPGSGPAVARNLGTEHARADWVLYLDADDYLMPRCLERCLDVVLEHGGWAYVDWFAVQPDGSSSVYHTPEWDAEGVLLKGLQQAVWILWCYCALSPTYERIASNAAFSNANYRPSYAPIGSQNQASDGEDLVTVWRVSAGATASFRRRGNQRQHSMPHCG